LSIIKLWDKCNQFRKNGKLEITYDHPKSYLICHQKCHKENLRLIQLHHRRNVFLSNWNITSCCLRFATSVLRMGKIVPVIK
jgi:hypothetical protein